MKKELLFFLLLFGCIAAKPQTIEVSGAQSGTWNADTVLVVGDIKVRDSLRILGGTTVLFADFYNISVKTGCSLNAIGTETDSILFTVADTTGFHLFNSGRGGWNGIRLDNAAQSKFNYCRFQYGKAASDREQDGGALRIYNCDDVEISNSTLFCNFSRQHGGALNAEHSAVTMHDCNVDSNLTYTHLDSIYYMYAGGLRFINCNVELTDMAFRHNTGTTAIGGAMSLDSCSVTIDRCIFEDNYGLNGAGLYMIRCYDNPCSITNSLFVNNYSGHFGGGLAISDSSPEMSNLTIVGNHSEGVNCAGIFFYQHSQPIVRNCIIFGNTCHPDVAGDVQIWIWTYDDYAPEFHNCLIEYGLEGITGYDAIHVFENCLDQDPLFAAPESNNYSLRGESPCIDAGMTLEEDFAALDLNQNARVCNGNIDLGAYEYTVTGVGEITKATPALRVMGNPIVWSSMAEIEINKACPLMATVYSIDGKLLASKDLGIAAQGMMRFEIGDLFATLPSGTYLLIVTAAEKPFVAKVVK